MKEKSIFVSDDGTEFTTKKSAIRHDNKIFLEKEFSLTDTHQINDFVSEVASHPLGRRVAPVIGTAWESWDNRRLMMFSDIAHQVRDARGKTMIIAQFMRNRFLSANRDNVAEFTVEKPADHSAESLMSVLTDAQAEKLGVCLDFDESGHRTIPLFSETDSTENKYVYIIKQDQMGIKEKMDAGIPLSESDMQEMVCYPTVYEEEGYEGRWTRHMTTVVDFEGDTYAIFWEKGLTENQCNYFGDQPHPCHLETKEVVRQETTVILDD